jgi:hypothetical protein
MPNSARPESQNVTDRWLSRLVAIATILGIPFALYGYYSSQHATRLDRTFEFYKDFRGETLAKDFGLLAEAWNAKSAEVTQLKAQSDYDGLAQLAASILQGDDAQDALTQLIIFFDEMYSCVDSSLCDQDTTIALLQEPANEIFTMYGSYLIDKRKINPNYANGIVKIRNLKKTWSLF